VISGNLRANPREDLSNIPENMLTSSIEYTTVSGGRVSGSTTLGELASGTFVNASIKVTGYKHDGTALTETDISVSESTTFDSFLSSLDTVLGSDNATASLVDGRICITDVESGYSRSDIKLELSNGGTANLTMPGYFDVSVVGGEEVRNVSITAYDSLGGTHVLSGAFVRTNTPNTWDLVLTSVDGQVHEITFDNRRIEGISFDADGAYSGLSGSDSAQFVITFAHNTANPQTIEFDLGTAGKLTGLTQFAEQSTAAARGQNGYGVGSLSGVSVNNEGIIIGAFSNGVKKNIAALQIALFQNAAALESIGGGYFTRSANSGDPVGTQGLSSGAGRVHGGALEKSNVDVATEFVNMIQAQNGFQANARTIRVANDILRELSNLIR
jgi:flagellar hook protein FlgE